MGRAHAYLVFRDLRHGGQRAKDRRKDGLRRGALARRGIIELRAEERAVPVAMEGL